MKSNPASKPVKVTVLDVAAAAKVAVGTVSRVLNTPDAVGPEIRQRVLDAVGRINYKPLRRHRKTGGNLRGGVRRQQGNIGVLLMGMDDSLTHLPVISEVLHGVELAMAEEGLNLMLANVPQADRVPAFLANNQVDGLILKCPLLGDLRACANPKLVDAINRIPHIWLLGKPESAEGDMCGSDGEAGTAQVAKHLYARGHRRIGYLHPRPGQTRSEGVKHSLALHMRQLGMELRIFESASSREVRWPLPAITSPDEILPLLDVWAALPEAERPTALVVTADSIAVQVYHALHQRGKQVGRDLSLISINHERPLVVGLNPSLTTIDIRAQSIGRRAVEQLRWRMADRSGADTAPARVLIEPRLVEGGSVARLTPHS